jgi:hypothetical protein
MEGFKHGVGVARKTKEVALLFVSNFICRTGPMRFNRAGENLIVVGECLVSMGYGTPSTDELRVCRVGIVRLRCRINFLKELPGEIGWHKEPIDLESSHFRRLQPELE